MSATQEISSLTRCHLIFSCQIGLSQEAHTLHVLQTDKDRLDDSYAALERKAELYDKLTKGQYEDDGEQYNVDFLAKGFLTDEMRNSSNTNAQDSAMPIDSAAMAVNATGEHAQMPHDMASAFDNR